MATTLQYLVDETRNFVRDVPDYDQLVGTISASPSSGNVTFQVADNTQYRVRWPVEIDYETFMLRSVGGTTSLTGTRAWRGSAPASHASSAPIQIRPAFYAQEIIDAVNGAIYSVFPWVYQPVVDTSLTVLTNQYQYVVPNLPGYSNYPIPYLYNVEILQPGDFTFRRTRRWQVNRGTVTSGSPSSSGGIVSTYPVFQFKSLPPIGATIRVHGFGPFPPLVNLTDTLDPLFPPQVAHLLPRLAGARILASAEAGRDRSDVGPVDRREEANRAGSSLQTAMGVLNAAQQEIIHTAMPPMPRHVKAVI